MQLGEIESYVALALRVALAERARVSMGPRHVRPDTGIAPEVWLHAARFTDLGGMAEDGGRVAPRRLDGGAGMTAHAEERPARIELEIGCIAPSYAEAMSLARELGPAALCALEAMPPPLLAGGALKAGEAGVEMRFADIVPVLHAWESHCRESANGHWYESRMLFRLEGFLHLRVVRPDGSGLLVGIAYDPEGADVAGEHVLLKNPSRLPFCLSHHVLADAARRPHRYQFPAFVLAPGAEVRIWTGRGKDDAGNLHWGRRQAVWNNTGDTLRLLDPHGVEILRHTYVADAA